MSANNATLFDIERMGETVVLVPRSDLSEPAFGQVDAEVDDLMQSFEQTAVKNVVIDCHKTRYFGSIALGFFMKLWLRVRQNNGRMGFCNVSAHEREIFQITKTDSLWSICSSRDEALEAVRG